MTEFLACDVVILGSGFGGSLLAAALARGGLRVALLDRQRHPRFAIGESSTPAADVILHDLAVRFRLPELLPFCRFGTWRKSAPDVLCGCKRGFTYLWHGNGDEYRATDDHAAELLVTASDTRESADTHWYRPDVDRRFADIAETAGAERSEGFDEIHIDHPGEHDWRIDARGERSRVSVRAPFAVDATGPAAALVRHLGVPDASHRLKTASACIYTHVEGMELAEDWLRRQGARMEEFPYPCDQAAVHHLFRDGWAFQLRFETGRTSVGFSHDLRRSMWDAPSAPDDRWRGVLAAHAPLAELLRDSSLATFPGTVFVTPRMQRLFARGAGTDWAALPHTVGFIDPLQSTGIAHTLSGVERLACALLAGKNDAAQLQLQRYACDVVAEVEWIDLFVSGLYATLDDFRAFVGWLMIYFAAATGYERVRIDSTAASPGFLLADVPDFRTVVFGLRAEFDRWSTGSRSEAETDRLLARLRAAVAPFDHVGLFTPAQPNMYSRTAAEKPNMPREN